MEQPNLNYIDELAGNDDDFRAKLVNTIKRELPNEVTEYKNTINNSDFLTAANHVHKLKHKISVMGMEKSYYIAEEFEHNLKNHSADLRLEFENILTTMQNFADGL
ncbi:MAG: histidine kinase [Flavobacterium sp. MedPE-SWcel]|uniref:Hpt domain-containing protein n=1 Tax=uncultured Flavobacterium sp. TaxID=165435 RepID=UPI00091C9883|nr:Hpt domain-containing protein [uncultured Flavobacterium sp.]OIQ20171.1 MAG: histidine kinase [Flavobacterium sp. MedPE-SWcel]